MSSIKIVMGDITQSDCECIVNAANKSLLGGGGVDGAIHKAAGIELFKECRTLGGCMTGEAKITKGYNLKARYIIHTVGPIYAGLFEDAELLQKCYFNSLDLAKEYDIHSISFPAISAGAYGYPPLDAAYIAVNSVLLWIKANPDYDISVEFCCFGEKMYSYYTEIYGQTDEGKEAIEMNLADEPFEKIASGEKTVEIRLYDEKRHNISVGDKITFYRLSDKSRSITVKVKALHRFDTFEELFSSELFPKTGSGNLTAEQATESMYKYYTKQQERQYGVLGIEIRRVE